jgi:putative tricarboxylic transport membrane protein
VFLDGPINKVLVAVIVLAAAFGALRPLLASILARRSTTTPTTQKEHVSP